MRGRGMVQPRYDGKPRRQQPDMRALSPILIIDMRRPLPPCALSIDGDETPMSWHSNDDNERMFTRCDKCASSGMWHISIWYERTYSCYCGCAIEALWNQPTIVFIDDHRYVKPPKPYSVVADAETMILISEGNRRQSGSRE